MTDRSRDVVLQDDDHRIAVPPSAGRVGNEFTYHVRMSAEEVKVALASAPHVLAFAPSTMPDLIPPVRASDFVLEFDDLGFRIHRSASERGQSGTGVLTTLYLRGKLRPTAEGTMVRLRFARGRPTWALQRAAGLILTLVAGLAWVAVGGPQWMTRAVGLAAFALFTSPLLANDLRQHRRMRADQGELLSLAERVLGPNVIAGGAAPYRD